MRQNDGYLFVTKGRMTVIYQLYEAGWWLSISYMRQDGGYLSVKRDRMVVIFKLHEAG
jgi:viroplasmin and RNaseH domain-containing protein